MESKWVGESSKNWRNLFDNAKSHQPAIIFIDKFDAVARKRSGSEVSRHDDKDINTILKLMSNLEKDGDMVYVIAATNNKDIIDPAMLRSGRFGKHIQVPNPDLEWCLQIFNIHTKDENIDSNIDRDEFAQKLKNANVSGADIAAIVADARNKSFVRANIFEKMENGTYSPLDVKNLQISEANLNNALNDFKTQAKKQPKNLIGFKSGGK